MKHATIKKLKSTRGSGIAEALVGFLIAVLSTIMLVNVTMTTKNLIEQGDSSIKVLYREESKMDAFVNDGVADTTVGTEYSTYSSGGVTQKYHLYASGLMNDADMETSGEVSYYVTEHHHLFGLFPNSD